MLRPTEIRRPVDYINTPEMAEWVLAITKRLDLIEELDRDSGIVNSFRRMATRVPRPTSLEEAYKFGIIQRLRSVVKKKVKEDDWGRGSQSSWRDNTIPRELYITF